MYRRAGSPEILEFESNEARAGRTNNQEIDIFAEDRIKLPNSTDVVIDVDHEGESGRSTTDKCDRVNHAFQEDEEYTATGRAAINNSAIKSKNELNASYDEKCERNGIHALEKCEKTFKNWMASHAKCVRTTVMIAVLCLYNIYLGFAISLTSSRDSSWCEGVRFLVLLTAVPYLCAFFKIVANPYILRPLFRALAPLFGRLKGCRFLPKIAWAIAWCGVLIFLVLDTQDNRYRLVSAGGLMVLLLLGYAFSTHRKKVMWRNIQCGVMAQFIFGLLILRWEVGRSAFQCLGNKVKIFLEFTDVGSSFVFGYLVTGKIEGLPPHPAVFAFKVLCTVVFFSFLVSVLYYYGIMQILVINVGWLLQCIMGTTACESMNAAGNIFLGMTESPLVIRPYLPKMTKSELHAVMTGGFATIAGSVMAAYISFGVNASHLLSASVMSAPAALAFSKLFYPETEESITKAKDIDVEIPKESNALEAASNGASNAIFLVSNIAANLVAFVAFIALMDSLISYFGSLVNWDFLSFQWLMSKLFIPFSLLMGVSWEDKESVANLIGLKTVINEFVAYSKLSEFQKSKQISPRSEAIATFALCGFSNFASIGIQLGALGAMAPERKSDLASIALRAMIAGSAACFMTACVAGTLLNDMG